MAVSDVMDARVEHWDMMSAVMAIAKDQKKCRRMLRFARWFYLRLEARGL